MNKLEVIKKIRSEIFRLAKLSPTLEIMHWYIALDNCFENDEFDDEEFGNAVWRCRVLLWEKQPVMDIACDIDALIKYEGYEVINPDDILKTSVVKKHITKMKY